jgi:hypothetical protein
MSLNKNVTEVFIGAGSALSANNTALNAIAVQTGCVGADMLTLDPAGNDTTETQPYIYIVNKLANGDFKRSSKINGSSVVNFRAESYQPSRRCVWGIGYTRAHLTNPDTSSSTATAAAGSIEVNASTDYVFRIVFKNDKSMYSVRPETLSVTFTSSASATQLSIATQIAAAINSSAHGSSATGVKDIIAVVVADGTGAYGLTGATNYGVEITGLTINQFQNTQYGEELVNFSVHVDDASGMGATTCSQIQTVKYGTGTYNQVYNLENKYYGTLNNTTWPIPVKAYLTSTSGVTTGAYTLTSATTVGVDLVTFSASVATGPQIQPGSLVSLDGVFYEVKYMASTTVAILTSVATSTNATGAVLLKGFYDMINITINDVTRQDGSGVGQISAKSIVIASPAILSGQTGNSAGTTASAESQDWMDILNAWMATTPLNPTAISI